MLPLKVQQRFRPTAAKDCSQGVGRVNKDGDDGDDDCDDDGDDDDCSQGVGRVHQDREVEYSLKKANNQQTTTATTTNEQDWKVKYI